MNNKISPIPENTPSTSGPSTIRPRRSSLKHNKLTDSSNTAFAAAAAKGQGIANDDHHSVLGSAIAVVIEAIENMKLRKNHRGMKFVMAPGDPLRRIWDVVILLMVCYTATFTPFQVAFYSDTMTFSNISEWPVVFIIDRVVDFVFLLDIFVNFRMAWVTDEGIVCFDQPTAAKAYLTGWFSIDIISLLPFDLVPVFFPHLESMTFFRLPKLLRLGRLAKVVRIMTSSQIVRTFEETTSVKYGWIRLLKFAVMIVVVSHWMACLIFFGSIVSSEYNSGWVYTRGLHLDSVATQYATALYWAVMTLTSVGYGDIVAQTQTELWLFSFLMFISAGIYAYIVGTMCSLVQGLDASNLAFQQVMDEANEYMVADHLPTAVRYRIRKFMFYRKHSALKKSQAIMNIMSPSIQQEVALYNYETVLASVPQFRGAPQSFLASIALVLRQSVYGPNEVILAMKRSYSAMYIINKGRVQWERLGRDNQIIVVRILRSGSFFGERAILRLNSRSTSTFRTLSFVEACELRKSDLDPIMREYPEVKRIVHMSLMKEILFRNMRNGALRSIADQPEFQRLQLVKQTSFTEKNDSMLDLRVEQLQEQLLCNNKEVEGLTKQVRAQQEMLAKFLEKVTDDTC